MASVHMLEVIVDLYDHSERSQRPPTPPPAAVICKAVHQSIVCETSMEALLLLQTLLPPVMRTERGIVRASQVG